MSPSTAMESWPSATKMSMKKSYVLLLCFLAASLHAGVIVEDRPHPLLLNGKPFGNALTINGNLVMSLDDFFKGATGSPSPGTNFVVRGNQLIANSAAQGAMFYVRKAGEVSSHLVT